MSDAPERASKPASEPLPAISLWLVDGFNVLHAHLLRGRDRKDWWSAERRQLVIERAQRLAASGERVWVVFDGERPASEAETAADAPLRVVFARDADDWMLRAMRAATTPAAWRSLPAIALSRSARGASARTSYRRAHGSRAAPR